jgi:hypothetical protein
MDTFASNAPTPQDAAPFIACDSNNPDDWRYWATLITGTWQSSVANIIETGKQLNEAKDRLTRDEFGDLINKFLPFKRRTAQRLMKLARNPVLSNASHVTLLPARYATLAALDTLDLPPAELTAKINSGTINARMERKDVAAFKTPRPDAAPRKSAVADLKAANAELTRTIADLEEKLAAADGGDLFNWKTTPADKIAATIVSNVNVLMSPAKARKIATEILRLLDDRPKAAPKSKAPKKPKGKTETTKRDTGEFLDMILGETADGGDKRR